MKLASSLVWVALALPAFARDVTVRLWWLHPPTEARITRAGGSTRVYRAGAGGARVDGPFTIEVPGSPRLDLAGPLDVKTEKGHLALTLHMPLEEYVEGVLAGESSIFTSAEALKAMAVVARTYAVANLGRHRSEGFDFCDTTHCQDLRLAARSERLRAAAEATEAELVWFQGAPALTFYHRHCGGMTEDAHDVWPAIHEPYLRRQTDTFCLAKGRAEW
jgi:peptidoglycan hydrolase-like amidase